MKKKTVSFFLSMALAVQMCAGVHGFVWGQELFDSSENSGEDFVVFQAADEADAAGWESPDPLLAQNVSGDQEFFPQAEEMALPEDVAEVPEILFSDDGVDASEPERELLFDPSQEAETAISGDELIFLSGEEENEASILTDAVGGEFLFEDTSEETADVLITDEETADALITESVGVEGDADTEAFDILPDQPFRLDVGHNGTKKDGVYVFTLEDLGENMQPGYYLFSMTVDGNTQAEIYEKRSEEGQTPAEIWGENPIKKMSVSRGRGDGPASWNTIPSQTVLKSVYLEQGKTYRIYMAAFRNETLDQVNAVFSVRPWESGTIAAEGSLTDTLHWQLSLLEPDGRNSYASDGRGYSSEYDYDKEFCLALDISGTGTIPQLGFGRAPWGNGWNITKVTIGEGVTAIGVDAFRDLPYLREVNLPSTLESIGPQAFGYSQIGYKDENGIYVPVEGLERITIPASVKEIGHDAFFSRFLTEIQFEGTINDFADQIGEGDNTPWSVYNRLSLIMDTQCPWALANLHEPQPGDVIMEGSCGENLTWQALLVDMNGIPKEQVWGGFSVKLVISGTGPMDDYTWVEGKDWQEQPVHAPWETLRGKIVELELQEGITHIGDAAFMATHRLKEVVIPSTVQSIGVRTFHDCNWRYQDTNGNEITEGLESVTIPGSVTDIGDLAFAGNRCLTTVNYPGTWNDLAAVCQNNNINRLGRPFRNTPWFKNEIDNIPISIGKAVWLPTAAAGWGRDGRCRFTLADLGSGAKAGKYTITVAMYGKGDSLLEQIVSDYEHKYMAGGRTSAGTASKKASFAYDATLKKGETYEICISPDENETQEKIKVIFTVKPCVALSSCKVKLSKTAAVYTGKAIKPKVTMYQGPKELDTGIYSVKYSNNKNAGLAKVTVTAKSGTGFTGSKAVTFKINPKAIRLKTARSTAKNKLTVTWTKNVNAGGYQLQYSLNKNFKSGVKTKTIAKTATIKGILSGLKSKKTYYLRIRVYKKVAGKTYYSGWSNVLKAKIR